MTKKEILKRNGGFIERYISTLGYAVSDKWDDVSPRELEALKQLYQVYKDCGGLN